MLWLRWRLFVDSDWGRALIPIFIAAVITISIGLYFLRVDWQPTQTAYVEVVGKRWVKNNNTSGNYASSYYFATFKFPDGSKKEFNLRTAKFVKDADKTYHSIQEGDKGILSYKQLGDGTGIMGKRFVSFEKDEAPVKELARNS